jgi:hypothetical protein
MNINYTLGGINVVQLVINNPLFDKTNIPGSANLSLDINNSVSEIIPEGNLRVSMGVIVSVPDSAFVLFSIRTVFDFKILNTDEVIKSSTDLLPKDFIDVILGICYSTLRGIVFEKTNAYNGGVLLPIINPQELTREHKRVNSSEL